MGFLGQQLEYVAERLSALGYLWRNPSYREVRRSGGARDLYRLLNKPWLRSDSVATVLDVGANEGQFLKVARLLFPSASLLAFEPNAKLLPSLQAVLADSQRAAIFGVACGRESTKLPLHRTKFSPATSLLQPTALRIPDFPAVETEDTVEVAVERIDQIVLNSPLGRAPYLLKVDVQGFELEVLQGATGILHDVKVVLLEVNAVAFYEGQAGFDEIWKFMREHHFRLIDIGEPIRARATAEVLYFDVAFLNNAPSG